ncbi:MAG: DALR anticodon-binding domain-containing protein [Nostoc sp.]|uniref:DALR anticodon-binding domain-containing protein n=1 Tax=Nostoc sp. TaxID=1180 RepID=UPI002FFC353A
MTALSQEKSKTWLSIIEYSLADIPPNHLRYSFITAIKSILEKCNYLVSAESQNCKDNLPNIQIFFQSIQTKNQVYQASMSRQIAADLPANIEFKDEPKDWFIQTADFGDEYDRVLQHRDGEFTQLLEDIARYHQIFQQGYDKIILLRPPVYTGYDIQLTAAMQCLGYTKEQFQFIIVQPIKLYAFHKANQKIHPLPDLATEELISAIGMDALRWYSLRVPLTSVAPINISTAGQADDSLYRVQSAHFRCCTVLQQAKQEIEAEVRPPLPIAEKLDSLLQAVPQILEQSANEIAPHLVIQHLETISEICHQWLDSLSLTPPDYALLLTTKKTIFDLLVNILNVTAPE